jgi:hypothetical protein
VIIFYLASIHRENAFVPDIDAAAVAAWVIVSCYRTSVHIEDTGGKNTRAFVIADYAALQVVYAPAGKMYTSAAPTENIW